MRYQCLRYEELTVFSCSSRKLLCSAVDKAVHVCLVFVWVWVWGGGVVCVCKGGRVGGEVGHWVGGE